MFGRASFNSRSCPSTGRSREPHRESQQYNGKNDFEETPAQILSKSRSRGKIESLKVSMHLERQEEEDAAVSIGLDEDSASTIDGRGADFDANPFFHDLFQPFLDRFDIFSAVGS